MTKVIHAQKINDNAFYIDVLYMASTSYSKSLYPTIERAFKKYAQELMSGGTYSGSEQDIAVDCKIEDVHSIAPYSIKRITYTKQ